MCVRYNGDLSVEEIHAAIPFEHHSQQELANPRTNVGPATRGSLVLMAKGQLTLDHYSWGVGKSFNCRLESLQDLKGGWLRCRRAIVPMRGYYEWQAGVEKTPYYFSCAKPILALAVYDENGFAVLTRPATKKLSRIHHRMPILVSSKDAIEWIKRDQKSALQVAERFIEPEYHRVSTRVNKVSNQDSDLAKPIKVFDIGSWAKPAKKRRQDEPAAPTNPKEPNTAKASEISATSSTATAESLEAGDSPLSPIQ